MRGSRYLIGLLLAACVVAPVLIGASCPPPTNPPIVGIVPDDNAVEQQPLAACISGFVCVNLANGSQVPVQVALYKHNGFDPTDRFAQTSQFSCCTNPNSQTACPCSCPGKDTGNCKLTRVQIFDPINLTAVNGVTALTLAPNQGSLTRIRCGDVKSIGVATALATGNALTAPEDQAGPVYRDEFGGVACGQTVQFLVVDLNQTGGSSGQPTGTATLIIQTSFSQ